MKTPALVFLGVLFAAADVCLAQPASVPPMQPFTMDHPAGMDGRSPADLSFLLDAPAGAHGFVHEADGHLQTADGRRIRFWGVNVTDWSPGSTQIPSKQDAPLWAATLARYGVNCVRLQFLDFVTPRGLIAPGANTRALDPQQMDREDYFLAELEKRGIYIDFNLLVGRPWKTGDGVVDADKIGQGAKGISLFDSKLIELQKEYARQLLTHYNPYTKHAYRDDPGVAIVEINNENAIGVGFRGPSPYYDRELDALYNLWLRNNAPAADIWTVRRQTGIRGNDPVPLLSWPEVSGASPQRYRIESEFYLWLERGYFTYMRDDLRHSLGLQCVILATADHNHNSTGYPLELALSSFAALDGHDYWEGPWEHKPKSPMVDDPLHSTVVDLSRSPVQGKAYTVSEVNEPFPNDYEAEQIPILAAYGDLQDWDAILWYTFEPKKDPGKPYVGDPFDLSLDPVRMTQLASGALTFLRGDVSPAVRTVARTYSLEQVFNSYRLSGADRPYFTPGFPLWLPLQDAARIASLDGPPTGRWGDPVRPDPIVSDTQQLTWNVSSDGEGSVVVDTPRTQALIGFTRAAENHAPRNFSASVANPFCAIVLVSLDGRSIAQSSRLLLTAGSRVANTGMEWNSSHTGVVKWGGAPTLIEPVTGRIDLRGLDSATAVLAQPLDGAGHPLGPPLSAVRAGAAWQIHLGDPATTWYTITVQP